jgi:hypothetical protein
MLARTPMRAANPGGPDGQDRLYFACASKAFTKDRLPLVGIML